MRLIPFLWMVATALGSSSAMAGELFGAGVISTGMQETSATFTPDGNTVYFMRSDFAERDDTIMLSHRQQGRWSPAEVASFSGQWHDSEPALSPDGKRLFFVSNRPVKPGDKPLVAEMMGQKFAGKNLWYVERQANGSWGQPMHVDGAHNDGVMLYSPSVAANGDVYFSAHRPDSGKAYQIYVIHKTATGYSAPEQVTLGDTDHNRMDPCIDPDGRFILYAGNEGDSIGGPDIYIAFRQANGAWGKPERLKGDANSTSLDIAPSLGRSFGELYVSSSRLEEVNFPKTPDTAATLAKRMQEPLNGSRNIWKVDIADTLRAHGIDR
ncbi:MULTISPECIES: TolB family protein [Dyella]|uniref:WD40-like Beta Propeller Repeat n=2 Tax=Dyella TaxID=231454 RepID=A0A4R0YGM1_9GAMM|nr:MULTISPECIES: PD40 domain-containing protein [Dyella]TBR36073.1 hypothetical protein EYV96_15815 [Dyella terrae]TCI06122.1 hypothetical protein EZM97_34905 [Dyella soli]